VNVHEARLFEVSVTSSELRPLSFGREGLRLLDQRLLPAREEWVVCADVAAVADAIRTMLVRGAPAIGVAAAYGMALAVRRQASIDDLRRAVHAAGETLRATRPTAVNLAWATREIEATVERLIVQGLAPAEIAERTAERAVAIHEADVSACRAIGRAGADLLPGDVVRGTRALLTHCNAGALATGGYGTALGVVRAAREAGGAVRVIACETRPFLQGARLTAWELSRDGISVTLITDNMAAHLMARGEIGAVVVGADRIARNGDVANKIGTYSHALAARAHDLPFVVAAPVSTLDPSCPDGRSIPIEERDAKEVLELAGHPIAPSGVPARHPAFDVTPAALVSAIVTERGVSRPPHSTALAAILG
jgi:methylthioribose-1-phosphate isomerase